MSTIIISVVIFSLVILVVYRYGIKKKSSCDCSVTDCPINKKHL
ncbi:FeoB-associated Cys-rich membrane protein [Vagococcus penaei]|nr:FeoB-associated Cys-rich membrane protein [Vagococcus penaei]